MRLHEKYKKVAIPKMKEILGYKNDLALPKIEKVTINTGTSKFMQDEKAIEEIIKSISFIAGQKPVFTKAKKAVAGFKVREGMNIGLMVTLRKRKMSDFIDRLIHLALPRSRDFRGIDQKSVDQNGNLTIGIKEHIIFPEISHENVRDIFGMEVTVKTTAKNQKEGLELFKLLGFPIKK